MAERMTFPMYAIHRQQTQALWQAVQSLLAERGVMVAGDPPADDPEDLLAHWRQPRLLLSQTCGYPLVTQLPEVQTVGCFHYAAPGCEGRRYRSLLVVREADSHRMLADFLAAGPCAMPSTRSPATTCCAKWSRRSRGRGDFFGCGV